MRVLVTRGEPDAATTAAALRARGHEVVTAPLLTIEPIAGVPLGDGPWSAVVLTSANALPAVASHRDRTRLAALPAFAVGVRTAAAARRVFDLVLCAEGDVTALAALIAERLADRTRPVLHLAGEDRAGDLAGLLAPHGITVVTVVVYRAVAVTSLPKPARRALRKGRIDAVLHYSRRTAQAFVAACRADGIDVARLRSRHICISAQVAAPLIAAGAAGVDVASRPDQQGVFTLLDGGVAEPLLPEDTQRSMPIDATPDDRPNAAPEEWMAEDKTHPDRPAAESGQLPHDDTAPATSPEISAEAQAAGTEHPPAEAPAVADDPPPLPSRPDPVSARTTRGAGFGSMLTAGLLGGLVVAAAGGAALLTLEPDIGGAKSATDARIAALELEVRDTATRAAQSGASQQALSDLGARLTRLETSLGVLSQQVARTDKAIEDTAATAKAARDRAEQIATAPAAAMSGGTASGGPGIGSAGRPAELDAVASRLGALERTVAATPSAAVKPADLDAVAARVNAAERTLSTVQQQAAQLASAPKIDPGVRTAVVAANLRSAVERSAPFAAELAAAKKLVADPKPLAPLEPFAETGLPSTVALGREFVALVPDMLKSADVPVREGYLERLRGEVEKLVRVRPVKDAPGDDVAAVIGRAETKARQADIGGTLAELAKLPAAVRAPAEPWIKKAEARQAAVLAAQRLASGALGAL